MNLSERPLSTRLAMLALLVLVIPAGLYARRLTAWPALGNGLGAVLYEVAGIAFLHLLWPRVATSKIAVVVFFGTCAVEVLQLSDAAWLVDIRATTPGRLVLGANGGFDWADFPLYALGCSFGYALCRQLVQFTQPRAESRELPPGRDARES